MAQVTQNRAVMVDFWFRDLSVPDLKRGALRAGMAPGDLPPSSMGSTATKDPPRVVNTQTTAPYSKDIRPTVPICWTIIQRPEATG